MRVKIVCVSPSLTLTIIHHLMSCQECVYLRSVHERKYICHSESDLMKITNKYIHKWQLIFYLDFTGTIIHCKPCFLKKDYLILLACPKAHMQVPSHSQVTQDLTGTALSLIVRARHPLRRAALQGGGHGFCCHLFLLQI